MQIASVDEAQARLGDLLRAAADGEEVFITSTDFSVQLVPRSAKRKRQFGSARGLISMAPGFDEPLHDFAEYER